MVRLYKDKEHAEFEFTVSVIQNSNSGSHFLDKRIPHAHSLSQIGPIPVSNNDLMGKEIITRMVTNMMTRDKAFYTDSNGRDFLKRVPRIFKAPMGLCCIKIVSENRKYNLLQVRDKRTDWLLEVNEPIAGNYYPVNY